LFYDLFDDIFEYYVVGVEGCLELIEVGFDVDVVDCVVGLVDCVEWKCC